MSASGNGAQPKKTPDQVAIELRQKLEGELGHDRAEAIWRDPSNIQHVVEGEAEATTVAQIMLQAWRDLPPEEPRRRSRFGRGLRLGLVAAVAVWALSILKRAGGSGDEQQPPVA